MKTNGQRRPEEIEAEIERTRIDLNETLHAIEERLTPGQLVDQGLHYLRDSGTNEYLVNLRAAARRDPLPLALVGVGLAWLMLSGRRPLPTHSANEVAGEPSAVSSTMSAMKDRVSETTQRVTQAAHAARERASRVSESARTQAERLRGGYQHLVNEQPLALGAIGLALGAVLAAATPRTRIEEDLISGRTRGEEEEQALEREQMDSELLAEQSHSRPDVETRWQEAQQPGVPPDLGTMPP